ncbi:MAG: hypothetical protein BGO43_15415 [Gammaproteobacteria bacterium 39-13]|nr:bacteriocin [Gammaproteobacteria bacterium]OJV87803.1 MAG: hypothetical protein BGO43_15415 [Gammaproteobacteria bacterium 39-13]
MKVLNSNEMNQVSGGDVSVSITANVPDADVSAFSGLLGLLLTGQLDAASLANTLTTNADSFNGMPLQSITVGDFVITHK